MVTNLVAEMDSLTFLPTMTTFTTIPDILSPMANITTLDLIPTQNTGVGIYLLLIGNNLSCESVFKSKVSVLLSFFCNLLVISVIMLRPQKINSMDIFIIALATSDMLFALVIHPMLIATSFGANVEVLFSSAGNYTSVH